MVLMVRRSTLSRLGNLTGKKIQEPAGAEDNDTLVGAQALERHVACHQVLGPGGYCGRQHKIVFRMRGDSLHLGGDGDKDRSPAKRCKLSATSVGVRPRVK